MTTRLRVLVSIQQRVPAWQIPPACVDLLRQRFPRIEFNHALTGEARANGLTTCDVAYTWILSPDELATANRLRWVQTSAVAVDTLCLAALSARGIRVSNTREVQAQPIAEHVLACVLALSKQLPFLLERQQRARWSQLDMVGNRMPWMLAGRTLGVIGAGTIGRRVAHLAKAFGMSVVAVRRTPEHDDGQLFDRVFAANELDRVLPDLDVLVIAAPSTAETRGMIGAAQLARMKPAAVLVNVGRASILDTDALVDALREGRIGGAALDVFPAEPLPPEHPLWRCPNLILTPHTSGFRRGHWDEVIDLFSENLRRFEQGEELLHEVRPELGY